MNSVLLLYFNLFLKTIQDIQDTDAGNIPNVNTATTAAA